jgi:hypothetical protein
MRRTQAYIRLMLTRRWLGNGVLFTKALFFQIFSSIMTFFIVTRFTYDVNLAFTIMAYEFIAKLCLYFVFEINWNNLIKKI